ncbi:MAG TPA: T9SS type A sorting domain-containing protein [Chryseolinea sp.]
MNNDFFTVEKAASIEQFHKVGENVPGKGTVNLKTDYVARDENPYYGRSYYRLKQTDYDGAYTYSNVVAVDYEGPQFPVFTLYPNPSDGSYVDVEFKGLKGMTYVPVQIYNMQGQKILDETFEVTTPGALKRRLEFEGRLGVGLYIIKAGPTLNWTGKVVVE